MSRRNKNNHYHFAEQYTDGHYSRKVKAARVLRLPRRAVFFAVLVLLVLGVVTATFSANTSGDGSDGGSILISVRNAKANRDLALTGARSDDDLAVTGANVDMAESGSFSDLLYNSNTAGWGTNSTIACNTSGWISLRFTADTNSESFKIYHKNWSDAYFSKSAAAVSINTEYTLNNTSSNPNMTFSFVKNAYYGMKIANPDDYNNMKMTLYRLFDANSVFYIDVSDYWADDDPEIGGYFCDSTSNTATWVRATRCADISNSHLYRLVAPNSNIYSKLVLGRFQKGTTASQMSFSGDRFYNQSVDILYQASNTKIKLTSYGNSTTSATVSTSSINHTHTYNAYEYTRSSSSTSYSLAKTIASGTVTACGTSSISLSATDRSSSGYDFDGWYRGTTSGVNNATTLVSNNLSCTTTNYSGTSYYYAKYTLRSFNITYNADATPATATPGEIINPDNSVPSVETKAYGVDYTITSYTFERYGYTQVGWSTTANSTSTSGAGYYALGATYDVNANLTLYPVWKLNDPSNDRPNDYHAQDPTDQNYTQPKIITTGNMTLGGAAVDLVLDEKEKSADVTRSYSYTITGPNGSTSSVGTDPTDTDNFMKFTANTPGSYSVYITVTDVSRTNVTNSGNTATAVSNTATITVKPDVPVFGIELHNKVDDARDGTTAETAYKILLGNRYYFTAQIDSTYLQSHPASNYTYTWSTNADFAQNHIVGTGTSITFTNTVVPNTNPRQYNVSQINYDPNTTYNPDTNPDPRTFAEESNGLESVTLYCRATCNSASNDSVDKVVWYFIQPLIESFKYEPMQKIFNMNDQTVSLAAEYNIENDPSYTTRLKFANDNFNFRLALETNGFIDSFTTAIKSYLYPNGPKYFYIEMEGYNSMNELITSISEKIHTTVGTADSSAKRALYFNNSSSQDIKNYLVMCYFIDGNGTLRYQAAQDLHKGNENNEGLNYRVMIPGDAKSVRFGLVAKDIDSVRYYGTPTVENGIIGGFTSPIYFGYTDQVALSDSVRVITATGTTDPGGGLKSFTCTASSS